MVFFDANDVIIEHNDAFGAMVGEDVNLIGLRIEDLNIPQEVIDYHYSDSNSTETYDSVRGMWLQNTRHRVFEDDEFVGTVFVVADVTDLKKAEIKSKEKAKEAERIAKIALKAKDDAVRKNIELDKANQDKSVLLKEVHHRVKNNLQIILSFMRLDERNNKSPQEVVSSSYNRIKTMALIHEKTYQSENVSSVRIAEFIKSDVDSLMYAFGKKDINMENMI